MFPNLCNKCMDYFNVHCQGIQKRSKRKGIRFFLPSSEKTKMSESAESDLCEDENKWLLICITVEFSFNGSYWHINSLLSCIVPRISVVTCDQLVTRGREFESRRSLKISSMVQDSFLLQFVPRISIYLGFLPFSCLLSNFLDVDECTSHIHGCHYNASCNNTDGSYTCKCKTGFNCSKYKKCCLIFF